MKLAAIMSLAPAERSARIKRGLRNRSRFYVDRLVYSTFGHWLNRTNSRYMLEFRPDSHFDFDRYPDFEPLFNSWVAGNRHRNCGDLARFYAFYLNLRQILSDAIPGDFVELGVYKGNSATMLASFARRTNRRVFLFDTFEGFDSRDLHGVDSTKPVQFKDTSLPAVQGLVGTDVVTYVKGFFPESTKAIELPERIAVAHIDCDLYEPMKAGLQTFYPRLSPGGIMLLHDYSSGHWPGATQAVDEFFADVPEKPVLVPDKSGTAMIRKATLPN